MKIGKYELTLEEDKPQYHLTKDKVYIIRADGEGGQFDKKDLFKKIEAVIDEFYKENF